MSERRVKDGRPTGVSGRITRESIRNALGLGGPEPEVKPTEKLTPQQARRVAEGKPAGPGAPGYETVTVRGGRDAFEHLGKPDLNSAEAGKIDGRRIVSEPPPKPEPQRSDWNAVDEAAETREAVENIVAEYDEIRRRLAELDAKAPPESPESPEVAELRRVAEYGRQKIDELTAQIGQS